jgi:hypothetical protein
VRRLFEQACAGTTPDRLLEGEGTQSRYVTVRAAEDRLAERLGHFVRDAVAERLFRR